MAPKSLGSRAHVPKTTMVIGSSLRDLPLNLTDIPAPVLNIENRSRTNLFPWNGQFSPQLVEAFLTTYASRGAQVLDPFAGSGTVLYEAGRRGHAAAGCEINPAAFQMARTYELINISKDKRLRAVNEVEAALNSIADPLFVGSKVLPLKDGLISLSNRLTGHARELLHTLIIRLDFHKEGLDIPRVFSTWAKLKALAMTLPFSSAVIEVWNRDARDLPVTDKYDMVITSPPYINVFNYHQQYRASAEELGWDLLSVAKAEVGSNRKHRGNRFLTVTQYCLDMTMTLSAIAQSLKVGARIILVLGRQSLVRGIRFMNGEIVCRVALECVGLIPDRRQERVFKNRFGQDIYEDILHLTVPQIRSRDMASAREIAHDTLTSALDASSEADVRQDLLAAINQVGEVNPSPLYDAGTARRTDAGDRMRL